MPTLRLAMKIPKRADVWICPPLGSSVFVLWVHVCIVCSQVRVLSCPVLRCIVHIHVFAFFFLFGLICSDFFNPLCFLQLPILPLPSSLSLQYLKVVVVVVFSHQNYADPMPVRSGVISVRQHRVPRALQRFCPTAFKGRLKSQFIHTIHFPS